MSFNTQLTLLLEHILFLFWLANTFLIRWISKRIKVGLANVLKTLQGFDLLRYILLLIVVDCSKLRLLLFHLFLPLDKLADQYTDLTIFWQVGH